MSEKKETFPVEEKVVIKPNYANPGWIKSPNHRAFFLIEGASINIAAPTKRTGGIANVLSKEDKAALEKVLYMTDDELSVYRKVDNFWHTFFVRLTKDALTLDLTEPYDYIKYKILLAQKDIIAPSVKNVKDRATYKFFIERQAEVDEMQNSASALNVNAWSKFGEIATDKVKIVDFLKVYSESFPSYAKFRNLSVDENTLEFLKGQLAVVIEEDMKLFIDVAEDPLFEAKLLVSKCTNKGIIKTVGTKYYVEGEVKPFANSLKDACEFIENDKHQDFKLTLETRLER